MSCQPGGVVISHAQPASDCPLASATPKSGNKQLPAQDTHEQTVRMTDKSFDDSLKQAVHNVQNIQQNKDKRPEAASKLPANQTQDTGTRTKLVKFSTKCFIEQY